MFGYSFSWYLFALTLWELIIKTHLTSHDSSHGFINKNAKYLEDDFKSIHEELSSGLRASQLNDFNFNLKLEPSILDFKQRQLGIAHLEKVTLFNTDKNKTIDMTSISGSTAYFHSSFFETKKIPPNGNTTFNVVFLGREEGLVEGNLFIHSSDGYFKYNVRGATTYSRFRLRPIVGVKLPLNSTFSPLIYLYNPHPKPVQIMEVYSSGGSFHLELPTGDQEGPNDLWEIAPYQTKAIIRVRFKAKVVQNHTAYVRIKLNTQNELLVVPLEVEVTPDGELVHPQGGVDFGIGGNLDPPKEVKLCVSNPQKRSVRVHSVSTTSKAIDVSYEPVRIMPDAEDRGACTNIATLTLNWKTAFDKNDFSGKIMIKYRQGRNVTVIPYYLTVLDGGITFDPLQTSYFVDDNAPDITVRNFVVRNDFYTPVDIVGYEMREDAKRYFRIESFTPMVMKPTNEKTIFRIKLRTNANLNGVNLNSQIILKTNVTDIVIPLLSYKGKLKLYLPYRGPENTLDIGLVSYNTQKNVYFLLANPNPVSLILKNIRCSVPTTTFELMGCKKGNYDEALLQVKHKNLTNCINIKPHHYAVVKLSVQTSDSEGQIWGDVYVETQYEHMSIPVHYRVAPGKLEVGPDRLEFDQCFPGKICSHALRVHSTFREPMIIENIFTLPPDKRVYSKHTGHILAGTTKVIGHMYLNPNVLCQNDCYTGFVNDSSSQWLRSLTLGSAHDVDTYLVNRLYNRYLNETSNGLRRWHNLTVRIDTSEVRGHIFKTRVKMSWPSLVFNQHAENRSQYAFPTTQIGNISYKNITVRNPSAHNLVVQLVFDRHYGNVQELYKKLPQKFLPPRSKDFQQYGFYFVDQREHQDRFRELVDWEFSEHSVPLLLAPGENVTVTVAFRAEETNRVSALLALRNNLTALELVTLQGHGVHPQFKFGNRRPGSEQPLSFDVTERHVKECEKGRNARTTDASGLMVRRSFTAKNVGDVAIYVNSFYINDYPCEGYGFKVFNCAPFVLPPNGTKKIDIAFSPDLTLTKVTRTLILGTSLNFPVNYTLYTSIPSQYLNACADFIARPPWEVYLSLLTNTLMILMLVVVVFLAVLDAERIKKQAFGELLAQNSSSVQPVLDLRMIGQQTREEIKTVKTDRNDNVEQKNGGKAEKEGCSKKKEEDKYPAMVAVTGRSKKKLGKKNSSDSGAEMVQNTAVTVPEVQRKTNEAVIAQKHQVKHQQKVTEEPKKVTSQTTVKGTIKASSSNSVQQSAGNKKQAYTKNNTTSVPAVYEEETSSTTTESSSNNEDPDKENDHQTNTQRKTGARRHNSNNSGNAKTSNNKIEEDNVAKVPTDETQSTEEFIKHEQISHNKVERQRSAPKSRSKPFKETQPEFTASKSTDSMQKPSNNNRETKKSGDKRSKERNGKEKTASFKKQQQSQQPATQPVISDKSVLKNSVEPPKSPVPSGVTPAKSVWGENCATFSDVVARTESLSTNRPLCQKPTTKPTVYVEPYKQQVQNPPQLSQPQQPPLQQHPQPQQQPSDLGPVGSRRLDFFADTFAAQTNGVMHSPTSNSFFSTTPDMRQQQQGYPFVEDFLRPDNWEDYRPMNATQEVFVNEPIQPPTEDRWNHDLMGTNPFWSNNFNLLPDLFESVAAASNVSQPPAPATVAAVQQEQQQRHQHQQQNNYLWGSSSVWQPWTPAAPRTPTRTPPGFDDFVQTRNLNEVLQCQQQQSMPQRESYSHFPMSNIWNPDTQNPWNYQGQ